MVKTFDHLIRYLLEKIALCGTQGAHPADIIKSIEEYYLESPLSNCNPKTPDADGSLSAPDIFNVDRLFQEQVWRWLVRHPQCQVGSTGQGNQLNLSEIEAANARNLSLEQDVCSKRSQQSQNQVEIRAESVGETICESKTASGSKMINVEHQPTKIEEELRLFTSKERMWYTITGHGVDFSRVPQLEFTCLSIIAAHGPEGILQPALVKISGQDMRSVPRRTQRLYDLGYIVKRPIQTGGMRTSLCILKRFVPTSSIQDRNPQSAEAITEAVSSNSQAVFQQCFQDGRADLYAISRYVFDILNETKLITRQDLITKLGVTSLRWERRIVGLFLRKLAALGCVKQVKALDNITRPTLRYFRCIKFVREPGEADSQKLFGPGYGKIHLKATEEAEEIDSEDDDIDEYPDDQLAELTAARENPPTNDLKEVERLIPQWTGSGCVHYFIHDLVQRSGMQGMSTMDIKCQAFGKFMQRPTEHQLTRLVERWQISQPIHLRHLAVLRDTALTRRNTHYVHYTYENYKKLVENEGATWEAVITITKADKQGKGSTAALDAEAELDEHGFPQLASILFQGRENDATLSQCIDALNIAPIHIGHDLTARRLSDGTYTVQYPSEITKAKGLRQTTNKQSKPIVQSRARGRPRKIPMTGLPKGISPSQVSKFQQSQRAAMRYQKLKAEKEIERRTDLGEDFLSVRNEVFSEITSQYVLAGQEVPSFWKAIIEKEDMSSKGRAQTPEHSIPADVDGSESLNSLSLDMESLPSLPSIADHFRLISNSRYLSSTNSVPQAQVIAKINGIENRKMDLSSLPSVAAHSRPYLNSWRLFLETSVVKRRRLRGRLAKTKEQALLESSALDTVCLPSRQVKTLIPYTSSLKRKHISSDVFQDEPTGSFEYLPSVLAHTKPLLNESTLPLSKKKPCCERIVSRPHKKRRIGGSLSGKKVFAKPRTLQEKTYQEQSQSIPKVGYGVFIGDDALRARAKGQRGRTKNSRLGVFKSDRLRDFAWFVEEPADLGGDDDAAAHDGQENASTPVAIGSTSPSKTTRPPTTASIASSSRPLSNPVNAVGGADAGYISSHNNRNEVEKKNNMEPEVVEQGSTLNDVAGCTSTVVLAEETSGYLDERSQDAQCKHHLISDIPPTVSPFTPVNKMNSDLRRETAHNRISREPETTVSTRNHVASLQAPIIAEPQFTRKLRNIMSSKSVPICPALELQPSNSMRSEPIWGATTSNDELGSEHEIQPGAFTSDSPLRKGSTSPNGSSAMASNSLLSLDRHQSYSDALQLSGFSSTPVNEEAINLSLANAPSNLLPETEGNGTSLPKPGPESIDANSHTQKTASSSSLQRTRKRNASHPITRVALGGGSVGVLRRKIIMDIVESCGGVYSSPKELVAPFVTAWTKQNKPGRPDSRTVQTAFNYLVGSGKLRQLTFSFMNSKGVMITSSMATTTDVRPTDPKVKDMQRNMISSYPNPFFPPEVDYSEESRLEPSFFTNSGRDNSINGLELESEHQVQLQYKPGFDVRLEQQQLRAQMREEESKAMRLEFEAARLAESGLLANGNSEMLLRQRCTREKGPLRKVERLTSVKERPEVGANSSATALCGNGQEFRSILMLQTPPLEDAESAALELRKRSSSYTRPGASFPDCEHRGPSLERVDQRMKENVSLRSTEWSSRSLGNDGTSRPGPSRAFNRPRAPQESDNCEGNGDLSNLRESILFTSWGSTVPEGFGSYGGNSSARKNARRRGSMNGRKARNSKTSIIGKSQSKISLLGAGEIVESSSLLTATTSPARPAKRRRVTEKKGSARYNGQTMNPVIDEETMTLMNPHHVFHPATGTFSATFSGFALQYRKYGVTPRRIPTKQVKTGFVVEIDRLLAWELDPNYDPNARSVKDGAFINHHLEHPQLVDSNVNCKLDSDFEVHFSGQNIGKRRPRKQTAQSRVLDITSEKVPRGATNKKQLKRKRQDDKRGLDTRRSASQADNSSSVQPQAVYEVPEALLVGDRPKKLRRIRGPHTDNPLSGDDARRLLIAVMVIRTLVGGIERNIDWALVSRLFQPKWSQFYIQKRWGHVLHKYRLQVDQMQARFQMMFAKAYEDGTIPPINYDDLESYDWAWLVDWTSENIETSNESLPYLPSKRSELDGFFDLQETNDHDMADFYEIDREIPWQRRENLLHKRSFIYPSEQKQPDFSKPESEVAIAKSWIRANVLTPQATYSSDLARAKLYSIGEGNIDLALRELLGKRILSQQHKGRLVPGRNYDISDFFLGRLKKKLEPAHFRQAIAYKWKLDECFRKQDSVVFPCPAENGEVLAVMNMLAHQRIAAKPMNPPMKKFGLTDGGYRTRKMDKTRLNFDVEIRIQLTYIAGNPLTPFPRIPCSHLGDPMAKIPLWYDVHDRLIPVMWELPLIAVLLVLSKRPCATAEIVLPSVQPCLELWELEQILEWMVRAKVATKTGAGYALGEWWWMCLDNEEATEGGNVERGGLGR